MTTPQNTSAASVFKKVTAYTDNDNDKGYHHCFEQNNKSTLTFELEIDSPSVDNINFVLWNIHNPVDHPYIAESGDYPVDHGKVIITVGPDNRPMHLGPGPYCATLTASSPTAASAASKGARKIVDYAIYYYETWDKNRDCKYEKTAKPSR